MPKTHVKLEQRNAEELAHNYNPAVRTLEVLSVTSYAALMVWLGVRLWPWGAKSPWLLLAAFLCGYLAADFVSGFVHWLADTWGSPDMPVIGNALLRPFREHHIDPEAITRHDFIETNGNNCLISIPVGIWADLISLGPGKGFNLFWSAFLGSLILWVLLTNQFHKWSHLPRIPWWIALLQKSHLILPVGHHDVHHTAPFHRSYCITSGWVNYPLNAVRFFPLLERLVTAWTGLVPRADDIGKRAAVAVMEAEAPEPTGPAGLAPANEPAR